MKERHYYLVYSQPSIKHWRNKINDKIWPGNKKASDKVDKVCVCVCVYVKYKEHINHMPT